jgi:cell division septation protein DedD
MVSGNIKKFELTLGRTGLVMVIVGMAALLCCTFLFGVEVGKNIDTYPEKIASLPQQLLALVWRPAKIRVAQNAAENKTVQNQPKTQEEPDLTFFNTLTNKKGMVKEQPIPDKKPAIEAPAARRPLPQPKNDATAALVKPDSNVKKQQAAKSASAGDEIEAKIKEAEPKVTANGSKFVIQAASMKEKAKADELNKKIKAMGFTTRIVENDVPGKGKWFRIVVEGFSSKANAQTAAAKISGKTGVPGIIKNINTAANDN